MAMFETYKNIPLIRIYVSKPNEKDNEVVRSVEEEVDTDNDSVFSVENQNADTDDNAKNQNVENENAYSDGNAENQNAKNDEFGNIEVDDEELDDVSMYAPSDELWSIHSESDDKEINSAPRKPKTKIARDERNKELVIGMKFANAKEFKVVLREHVIANRYDIRFKKNERKRVTVICVNECRWRIHATLKGNGSFELSTIKSHDPDCPEAEINRLVTSTYIAKKYVHNFRKLPEWKNDCIQHHVADNLEIEVSRFKMMRAKRKALEIIEGHHEDQFSKIREYFALVMKTNPCSVCKIMLNVVGRDGDNSFYPIALVVEAETKDSLDWFIEEMAVISPHKAITWISDI
ncbi:uncharacterized protein LOC132314051 [Cornus florida]|uniref:uncharacterized protein LOC132314051 n=1 Tax=Cornus florida TaxID=4283 RepID=UPI00289BDAF3|nr:uncharacterized protein LOC132314051 [Cornus florida]